MMITTKITDMIKRHEGLRLKPYKCTEDRTTIGYGRNIEDNGISAAEAEMLLQNDLIWATKDAIALFPNFDGLTEARQGVLVDMSFNIGKARLSGFKKFIAAVISGDFQAASKEMLDSVWATQVKSRATELSNIMQRGEW